MVAADSGRELGVGGHRSGASRIDNFFPGRRRRGRDLLMRLIIDRFQAIGQLVP
jgi:hypothetical protein